MSEPKFFMRVSRSIAQEWAQRRAAERWPELAATQGRLVRTLVLSESTLAAIEEDARHWANPQLLDSDARTRGVYARLLERCRWARVVGPIEE